MPARAGGQNRTPWEPSKREAVRTGLAAAIAKAPEQIEDPDCPYDPNDPAAVERFWKNATVRRPGKCRL